MTPKELKTLNFYVWRVGKAGVHVVMPMESVHLLQRLAGENLSPHPFNACRVNKSRVIGWLRAIADKYPQAPQVMEGGW